MPGHLRHVEWMHLRSPELKAAADQDAIVVLPTASVEQHGKHLPVGTDTLTVQAIALEAARSLAGEIPVIVLPTVWSGFALHHMGFPGTITLSAQTFRTVVEEIAASVFHHGFERLVIVNGHGGNTLHLRTCSIEIVERWKRVVPVLDYWDLMPEGREGMAENPPAFPGHAGEFETSLQLHLSGADVDMEAAQTSYCLPKNPYVAQQVYVYRNFMELTKGVGVVGDPTVATAERGAHLFQLAVARLREFLKDFSTWDVHDVGTLFGEPDR